MDAAQAVSAEMEAYDAGVDTAAVQADDLPSARRPTVRSRPAETTEEPYLGGPFRRRGPTDDETPVTM